MVRCKKCGAVIENESDVYQHGGMDLCEDCYLDIVATPKTCDPWAVHSAKTLSKSGQVTLTSLQEKILDLIKKNGPVTAEEICSQLNISEEEFRSNFATLRHLELARACKVNDKVCYTTF